MIDKDPNAQHPISNIKHQKLVGIGGLTRSGKDTLADLFLKDGWFGINFGDVVRKESRRRHKNDLYPISVANMTETANWLRTQKGADFILKIAIEQFEKVKDQYKGLVAWAVRAPIEADYILKHGGELIWIDTKPEVRHQRFLADLRPDEKPMSLKEYNAHENLQYNPQPGIPEEVQMNTSYVQSHATKVIENNGTKQEFIKQAKRFISRSF